MSALVLPAPFGPTISSGVADALNATSIASAPAAP